MANAPAALDTLKEISDQLKADEQGAAAILSTQQQHTQQIQQLGQTDFSLQSQITTNLNNAVYGVGTGGSGSLLKKNASNVSSNYQSAVLGGESSTASGGYALVGSGYINRALGNWSSIIGGRNNTLGANSQETYGGIFGSSYCAAYAPYCGIYNSSNCTIAATCSYTTLIGCIGLDITTGSNQTYLNNVLVGTTSGGSASTLLVLDTTDALRVSPGIPVRAKFQISDEVLDVNATAISYQLDTNTRTGSRVYGSPDRTKAQINALLAGLTPTQISEGAKLYVKSAPTVAANPATVNILLTDL